MKISELLRYRDYNIPLIEFYNDIGLLEYSFYLDDFDVEDIEIVRSVEDKFKDFGIIKLKRNETKFNYKNVEFPKGSR